MMWYTVGGMSFLGPLMMIVFWVGVTVLIVWALRAFSNGSRRGHDTPLEILNRRLAAGEITQDQYEQARRVLQG